MCENNKIIEEFSIPVPWGHIAVKAWGSPNYQHVLVIHGTTDNAGSFDNLIPLLSNNFYYICIDLPSHGRSTHFPPFVPIHFVDYLLACKLVVDYFKSDKYIYIGHSLGAQIGYLFCRVFPQYIEKLICLEALHYFPIEIKDSIKYLKRLVDKNINIVEKRTVEKPSYSYGEILENVSKNRYHGEVLSREAAEPLLKRCLETTGNGKYTVTTDERVKVTFPPFHDTRYALASLQTDPIPCPVLVVFATMNVYPRKRYNQLLTKLTKTKNVKIVYVDGQHDVHNNNPRVVVPHVIQFLLSHNSKL